MLSQAFYSIRSEVRLRAPECEWAVKMRWDSLDDEQCSVAPWPSSAIAGLYRSFANASPASAGSMSFNRGLASRGTCLPCGPRSSRGSVHCGAIDAERGRPGTGMS
jgi:hypothetical protein